MSQSSTRCLAGSFQRASRPVSTTPLNLPTKKNKNKKTTIQKERASHRRSHVGWCVCACLPILKNYPRRHKRALSAMMFVHASKTSGFEGFPRIQYNEPLRPSAFRVSSSRCSRCWGDPPVLQDAQEMNRHGRHPCRPKGCQPSVTAELRTDTRRPEESENIPPKETEPTLKPKHPGERFERTF